MSNWTINVNIVKKTITVTMLGGWGGGWGGSWITSINSLTASAQALQIWIDGNDFNIDSTVAIHTFNLPSASNTKRGALTSSDWVLFNDKVDFADLATVATTNDYNDLDNLPNLWLYQLLSEKWQASGYAPLNASSKIPTTYLPDIAISEYMGDFTDLATALADGWVQASQRGDWFTIQTSWWLTYIVISDNPTVAWDVRVMASPTDAITSVNWQTGIVVLDTDDIGQWATNLYNQTHTWDVTGATALTIANNAVTNAKLATVVQDSLDLADSSLQSWDNVSELTNDSGYITEPVSPLSYTPSGTTETIVFTPSRTTAILDLWNATWDVTLAFTDIEDGWAYTIKIIQWATARDVIFPAWVVGADSNDDWDSWTRTLTISTTNNAVDVVWLSKIGTDTILTSLPNFW